MGLGLRIKVSFRAKGLGLMVIEGLNGFKVTGSGLRGFRGFRV